MELLADAELGTNGNNVATPPDAWDTYVVTGGPITYDSTTAAAVAHGSLAYKFALGGTLAAMYVERLLGGTFLHVFGRFYYYATIGTPGSSLRVMKLFNGATQLAGIHIASGTGHIGVRDSADANAGEGTVFVAAANTLYRIDYDMVVGSTTTGSATVDVYAGTSATLIETLTLTAKNFGSVGADRYRLGNTAANFTINQSFWLDTININDSAVPGAGPDTGAPPWPPAGSENAPEALRTVQSTLRFAS